MSDSTPTQLRFSPLSGFSVRADFDGGALSSDFGPILLQGVERQIGMIQRMAAAIHDRRNPSYINHSLTDLLSQRVFQVACGYADGNDANSLRRDPMFKLAVERKPLDEDEDLASAATFSRLEKSVTRQDIYRISTAFVEQFIASYAEAPKIIVLDMDHSEDRTHGQQELSFYNRHYRSHCYLPLFLFEGLSGKFITAALRPGKTPKGTENATIIKRVLKLLRQHWPQTHILLRGDGHFSNPELMQLAIDDPQVDFIFGFAGNQALLRKAQPMIKANRRLHQIRCRNARTFGLEPPHSTRTYHDVDYAAGSWPQPFLTVMKAETMGLGDNPRFIVTSLEDSTAEILYTQLYCARGQDENYIKAIKNDLASDRTSDQGFLANHLRLFYSCAAYVLHHSLRTELLADTALAKAQPSTVIAKLFKLAVRVVQYKDRIKLHLPTSCPVKSILHSITERLYLLKPALNTR